MILKCAYAPSLMNGLPGRSPRSCARKTRRAGRPSDSGSRRATTTAAVRESVGTRAPPMSGTGCWRNRPCPRGSKPCCPSSSTRIASAVRPGTATVYSPIIAGCTQCALWVSPLCRRVVIQTLFCDTSKRCEASCSMTTWIELPLRRATRLATRPLTLHTAANVHAPRKRRNLALVKRTGSVRRLASEKRAFAATCGACALFFCRIPIHLARYVVQAVIRATIKKCGSARQAVARSRGGQSPRLGSRHRKGATARC